MRKDRIKVLHSFPVWLAQTQTWMYHQIKYMPGDIENHIFCERTKNLDQFSVPNIHSLADLPDTRQMWDKAVRAFQIRHHLSYLTSIAESIKANVLHSHFGYIGWADMHAAPSAKQVVTFYGLDVNFLPRAFFLWYGRYKKMFRKVDMVLCEGSFMRQEIIKLGCPEDKVRVQHLGVCLDQLEYKPRGWDGEGPLKVLIAAAFKEKKGIPYALEALAKVRKNHEIRITVVGDAGSVSEKKKIMRIVEKNNMSSCVDFKGFCPMSELYRLAYEHHVFVSPSVTAQDGDTEGGAPVSIIEMAATGMPVISTRHCDISEVLSPYGELLAPERDSQALADLIETFLDTKSLWPNLLFKQRQYLEKEYDARAQGAKLAGIYRGLL